MVGPEFWMTLVMFVITIKKKRKKNCLVQKVLQCLVEFFSNGERCEL